MCSGERRKSEKTINILKNVAKEIAETLNLQLAKHHEKWLDSYNLDWDRRIQLPPRGHGKITMWGYLGILSILKMNPKTRILIVSKTEALVGVGCSNK